LLAGGVLLLLNLTFFWVRQSTRKKTEFDLGETIKQRRVNFETSLNKVESNMRQKQSKEPLNDSAA
ncbi:MAG: hypothetical protein NTX25_01870, partial [Proteobacteria bacterium]|nr:hypothetical protein [Pseudomonadota bacterium]